MRKKSSKLLRFGSEDGTIVGHRFYEMAREPKTHEIQAAEGRHEVHKHEMKHKLGLNELNRQEVSETVDAQCNYA